MRTSSKGLLGRFRRWRRYQRTVKELQGLSVRELHDIGITPGEIRRVAREASY
ncbi:DUF1127 domain-containing protein [Afifella pfennigii]|uniref:DUF1127 domain-containing protein n=1 Tax=Afifella pfennigii TaxID=209897 RepID=UPI000A04DB64|nr:DUF1127 domain-containing protein [Afifella pfennigii]